MDSVGTHTLVPHTTYCMTYFRITVRIVSLEFLIRQNIDLLGARSDSIFINAYYSILTNFVFVTSF